MNYVKFHAELALRCRFQDRFAHHIPGRGVYVKAATPHWHHFRLVDHPLPNHGVLPRLTVNWPWARSWLNGKVARAWDVPGNKRGMHSVLGLEVIVLKEELLPLAHAVPALIDAIELEGPTDFKTFLPFPVVDEPGMSLWSASARLYQKHWPLKCRCCG